MPIDRVTTLTNTLKCPRAFARRCAEDFLTNEQAHDRLEAERLEIHSWFEDRDLKRFAKLVPRMVDIGVIMDGAGSTGFFYYAAREKLSDDEVLKLWESEGDRWMDAFLSLPKSFQDDIDHLLEAFKETIT